ncbi:MAG TPA: TniQ family protein [Coleofasciculaceae cyanobacterium]
MVLIIGFNYMYLEDLELSSLPERSRLYHLEPIASGTPYVEGLSSYICRLAEAHSVSPGILIKKEILPSFRKSYSFSFGEVYTLNDDSKGISVSSTPKPAYRKNPNEYGLLAMQYLEGLKPLTLREDLHKLIIPPSIGNSAKESEQGRDVRAWCPECFQTWRAAKQPIYEPLFWSIAATTICPCHHEPLQSRCPHCQKKQRPLTSKTYVARCSQCSGWLGVCAG